MGAPLVLERRRTADDLLEMEDGDHYELVDGCLLELNVSGESSTVMARGFSVAVSRFFARSGTPKAPAS